MVLGDLNSNNELLALRSSGIPLGKVFRPILIFSLFLSLCTYIVSDVLLPWSNIQYKEQLTLLMRDMPTFELESNGVNTVSNIMVANGEVEDNLITDLSMMNTDRTDHNMSISSTSGELKLVDMSNFVYELSIKNPSILISDSSDIDTFVSADGDEATFYLDFSAQVPTLTSTSPVNLSSRELLNSIEGRRETEMEDRISHRRSIEDESLRISSNMKKALQGNPYSMDELRDSAEYITIFRNEPIDFYSQYYKAELSKKAALSLACFFLTLVSLPLGLLKVKYGKLTGFAISLLVAVAYWYMLFYAQLQIFEISMPPYLLMFAPNLVVGIAGALLLCIMRKAR